ncbi:MAG: hypothetical protein FJW83_02315 [Actinobacteria bacterium]|nr:hypothetical protein [Actinomycetota bacterium]
MLIRNERVRRRFGGDDVYFGDRATSVAGPQIGRTATMRAHKLVIVPMFAVALFGTACGAIAEKATEKAIEGATGADDVEITKDGGVKVKTSDGTFESGAATKLPGDIPKAPLFAGTTIQSSTKVSDASSATWLVSGTIKDVKGGFANLTKALKADGWEIGAETETNSPDYSAFGVATKGNLTLTYGTGAADKSFYYWISQEK